VAHTGYRCKHEDKRRSSDQQTQHRAQTEQAAIATVIQRLSMQFPEVPQQNIREAACGEFVDFKTSKVRDFVPIHVQRSVRTELAHAAPR
jgi:uncharacterized membrane protein YukC